MSNGAPTPPGKMRRSRKLIVSLGLLGASVLVTLLIVEVLLRLFVPIRLVGPSVTSYHPVYGHANKASFSSRQITPEYTWHFSFNSRGHRSPELEPNAGKPMLYLGDSFTVGLGVNDEEAYPWLVSEELRRREGRAIPYANAAVGNSGQGRWVKILRTEAREIDPCLIVLQILENDFSDNSREGLFTLQPDGSLLELPIPPPGRGRSVQALVESVPGLNHTYLYGLLRQAHHALRSPRAWSNDEGPLSSPASESLERDARRIAREDSLTYRLLEEAAVLIHQGGWPAIAIGVDLPPERLDSVLGILARHGIAAATIPGKRARPELYYSIDGHWNENGHREAAEKVLNLLPANLTRGCGRQERGAEAPFS